MRVSWLGVCDYLGYLRIRSDRIWTTDFADGADGDTMGARTRLVRTRLERGFPVESRSSLPSSDCGVSSMAPLVDSPEGLADPGQDGSTSDVGQSKMKSIYGLAAILVAATPAVAGER